MRKWTALFWIFLLLSGLSSFQKIDQSNYSSKQIESFIREVFAEQADELVFQSPTTRLPLLQDFLSRVTIANKPECKGKRFKLLSTLSLHNKYNPNLRRDAIYNAATFNPLKYNFPMTSRSEEIFRFDNSDYLIIIAPIK